MGAKHFGYPLPTGFFEAVNNDDELVVTANLLHCPSSGSCSGLFIVIAFWAAGPVYARESIMQKRRTKIFCLALHRGSVPFTALGQPQLDNLKSFLQFFPGISLYSYDSNVESITSSIVLP